MNAQPQATALELEVTALAHDGRGIARDEGKTVFIEGALPGERVTIRNRHRGGDFDEARVETLLRASPDRVEPRCAHYGTCGGCALQHMDPAAQLAAKQRSVLDTLARLGKVEPARVLPALAGPAWGYLRNLGFGIQTISTSYNPTTDAGLIRLVYDSNWSNAALTTYLTARGYNAAERTAIMSRTYDTNGAYPYRVAVALGLAYWNSGLAGGLWQSRGAPAGNNNAWISASEVEWTETLLSNSVAASDDIWLDYINNYMKGTSSEMYDSNSNFRYRFGIKTLVNYLMEKRVTNAQTPELSGTRTQPMQAVKDAVGYLTEYVEELNTDDMISLEIYGTTGRHEVDLTRDYYTVSDRLSAMQAGHYDTWTNIGSGLQRGIDELTSTRARFTSKKMIILMTDGNANVNEDGDTNDNSGGAAYALNRAQAAADQGIYIFAVSVGVEADQSIMQQIADIGHGEHFHAEGTIEEYSEQLAEIFRRLGGTRPIELIR